MLNCGVSMPAAGALRELHGTLGEGGEPCTMQSLIEQLGIEGDVVRYDVEGGDFY